MDVVVSYIARAIGGGVTPRWAFCCAAYAFVAVALLPSLVGCRMFNKQPASGDPFAELRAPRPLDRQASKTGATSLYGPGAVVPASFESPQVSSNQVNVGEGVSLGKKESIDTRSFWERATDVVKPTNVKNKFLNSIGQGPDEAIARTKLAEGNQLFQQKQFDDAAKAYKEAARRWPDSILEEDAQFMRAECYFFADRYSWASDSYAELLKKYENSRYLDTVMKRQFAIGRYWDAEGKVVYNYVPNITDKKRPLFDTSGHSVAVYESIRLNDPTGPLADDAVMSTANYHFVKGHYEDASYQYDILRKDYPRSEHQLQAHVLGLQSRMRSYQGSQYDSTPLDEAEKIANVTVNQFGAEIPEERARLIEAQNQIRVQQAERDYANGEYYYNRRYYGAARHYYQQITDRYPETAVAQMARERLDATKDLPVEPPNYFGWLGKVFGERDRSATQY